MLLSSCVSVLEEWLELRVDAVRVGHNLSRRGGVLAVLCHHFFLPKELLVVVLRLYVGVHALGLLRVVRVDVDYDIGIGVSICRGYCATWRV